MIRIRCSLFIAMLSLLACTGPVDPQAPIHIAAKPDTGRITSLRQQTFISHPQPQRFTICHGHTCAQRSEIRLREDEWQSVRDLFQPQAITAQEERQHIAEAIALLERLSGAQAGTLGDLGQNTDGLGQVGQLDCIDESTNTTVYLRMLINDGLLHWHQQGSRHSRGIFTGLLKLPHSTAVIIETETGSAWAVDSWYGDNGMPADIVPLDSWMRGWSPAQSPVATE